MAKYLKDVNHFFPIFSRDSLKTRLLKHSNESTELDSACFASLHAVQACINQHQHISDFDNTFSGLGTAVDHLQKALSVLDKIILQPPTLLAIQALACMVLCLQHIKQDGDSATNILAIAIRKTQMLRFHRLDELTDLSVDNRLERLRLFWCLYVLDKDMSMHKNVPPMIDNNNVRVLEPKMISDDYCGFVQSTEGDSALNLFAARQRLAWIESNIWESLHTFKSQHQPSTQRKEAIEHLNDLLIAWKAESFDYGAANSLPQKWPSRSLIPIVSLQFQYFLCLLRANPDTPSDAVEVKAFLSRFSGPASALLSEDAFFTPSRCIDAARDTARLATVVRKGGLAWMW